MAYTERQVKAGRTYLYRVRSVRRDGKVVKERVYLGPADKVRATKRATRSADRELGVLSALLTDKETQFLDKLKRGFAKEPKGTRGNRYEAFVARFTYDSNAIEGNTLTLDETSQLLFEGLVPPRSLREVNEALNHKEAFDHLLAYRADITKRFILRLHEVVIRGTLPKDLADQAGTYRSVQVFIRGVAWTPPAPNDVPKDMKSLLTWYAKNRAQLHPLVLAAYFHAGFELVHPFVDGNGRVGRLLMNFILHRNGYPMIDIPFTKRREYYAALHEAQVEADLRPFVELLLDVYRAERLRF